MLNSEAEDGIISRKYLAHFNDKKYMYGTILQKVKEWYRCCSENTHGRYECENAVINPEWAVEEAFYEKVTASYESVTELICVLLAIRFSNNINAMVDDTIKENLRRLLKKYEENE